MAYRDDRDALRSEVDALQQELASARDDQQRLASLEHRLEAARREVSAIEADLGRARAPAPGPAPSWSNVSLVVGLAVLTVGAAIVGFFFMSREPDEVVAVEPTDARPRPQKPAPLAPIPETPQPTPAPAPPRRADVVWTATVTRAQGLPLAVGTACTVRAGVIPDSSGMHPTDVEVTCGGRTIYDEKVPLNGMSMLDSGAAQRPGAKAGTWVYELAYRDKGDRSPPRNQADLDSTAKVGKVWSDNLPELRVDLAIKPGSAPVDVAVME